MLSPNTTVIPKELVATLRFPKQPLPMSDSDRDEVRRRIGEAARLGNGEHGKCRIIFQDAEGEKAVETTIWTYDRDNIVLKYGMTIPIARVLRVEIP
jgi:hypothetical protein